MQRHLRHLLAAAALGLAACDSTDPSPAFEGIWLLSAYESDGVAATAISGQANFLSAGTFTITGSVTYPGEPPEAIAVSGTWSLDGSQLTLDDGTDAGTWLVTFSDNGNTVVIQLQGDASASRLTMVRPGAD